MNLTDVDDLKSLLSRYHLRPDDRLGQNFLVDAQVLDQIVSAADLTNRDIVLEIGAGLGTLTVALAEKAKMVLALEKDKRLMKTLQRVLKDFPNVTAESGDILKFDWQEALKRYGQPVSFKVVANIPYYITGQIIKIFLESHRPPSEMILLVQKEVGERLAAIPGKMSVLSVTSQFFTEVNLIGLVPRAAFWPSPTVDSAIVKLKFRPQSYFPADPKKFFSVVKIAFAAKRKTLLNNLSSGLHLDKDQTATILDRAKINPGQRAQELSMDDWHRLYVVLENKNEKSRL